ncbi:hypothetical protein REPUB_Repub19eG0095800 [Reevesia pubescens]
MDYKLLEEIGHGANARIYRANSRIYRAIYLPLNRTVAIKSLDLDRCNMDDIKRETQIMKLVDHPDLLQAYTSFMVGRDLWIVMPFMSDGSCFHVMKKGYAESFGIGTWSSTFVAISTNEGPDDDIAKCTSTAG